MKYLTWGVTLSVIMATGNVLCVSATRPMPKNLEELYQQKAHHQNVNEEQVFAALQQDLSCFGEMNAFVNTKEGSSYLKKCVIKGGLQYLAQLGPAKVETIKGSSEDSAYLSIFTTINNFEKMMALRTFYSWDYKLATPQERIFLMNALYAQLQVWAGKLDLSVPNVVCTDKNYADFVTFVDKTLFLLRELLPVGTQESEIANMFWNTSFYFWLYKDEVKTESRNEYPKNVDSLKKNYTIREDICKKKLGFTGFLLKDVSGIDFTSEAKRLSDVLMSQTPLEISEASDAMDTFTILRRLEEDEVIKEGDALNFLNGLTDQEMENVISVCSSFFACGIDFIRTFFKNIFSIGSASVGPWLNGVGLEIPKTMKIVNVLQDKNVLDLFKIVTPDEFKNILCSFAKILHLVMKLKNVDDFELELEWLLPTILEEERVTPVINALEKGDVAALLGLLSFDEMVEILEFVLGSDE